MTTRRDLLSAAALLAPMAFALKSSQAAEEQHKEDRETGKMADFLFVQNAKGITYADGKLTLQGVSPATVVFSDRPERIAGHMTTARFVPFRGEGKDSFLKNPPNATLSFLEDQGLADATAKAATEIAKDVDSAAAVTQGAADVATEAAADVNAAKAAGDASSMDAEAADVASEVTNEAAAEMIEAKEVANEAAKEAKTDAVLEDSKTLIQGD